MKNISDIEKKANLYAGSQLRALRGNLARVPFGKRIGMKESLLYSYERGEVRLTIGRMAAIAKALGVPFSTFILPDNDAEFSVIDAAKPDQMNEVDKLEKEKVA